MPKSKLSKTQLLILPFFIIILSCSNVQTTPKQSGIATDKSQVEIEVQKPEPVMVYYEDPILHIFFHPLVAKPEIAFKGDMKDHFLDWFVTADEFRKVLYEMYIGGYVLIDVNEIYEVQHTDGVKKVVGKKVLIPEGKKPMLLSVDDLNYYEHCRENGVVHKLVIDENGEIAAWTDNESGGELSYDQDIVTVLEDFIRQYPDFSIRGAKGIIAVTGYEGLLGYQTDKPDAPGYRKEIEDVTAVVKKLKENGWVFASHSWGHLNMPTVPMSWFTHDLNLWDRQIKPILGDIDLYIYPFGAKLENQEDRHKLLRDRNYHVFFGVGSGYYYHETQDYIYMDRINIDGYHFRTYRNRADRLFDIDKVVDDSARGIGG